MDKMLAAFNTSFEAIDARSHEILRRIDPARLYERPSGSERLYAVASVGESILRSAAAVEQTFLGITRRLWDDPFEWTLPEKLATQELVTEYLDEVAATTANGLAFLASDEDLSKQMPSPETLRPIFDILLDTISRAEHYQGRAAAILDILEPIQTFRR